jgi:hypothetical protein
VDKHGFREIQKKLRLTNEGVSETMDVELFTVQNWATGAWPIPKAIAKFLHTLVVLSKKEDPLDVYAKGHATGYSRGYSKGSNDGFTAGKQVGYTYGCEDSGTHEKWYAKGFIAGCETEK